MEDEREKKTEQALSLLSLENTDFLPVAKIEMWVLL